MEVRILQEDTDGQHRIGSHTVLRKIARTPGIVLAGDEIRNLPDSFLAGHGVLEATNGKVYATRRGIVQQVNKLVFVEPLKSRYEGGVGDVIIGRVADISQNKWKLEVNAPQLAALSLAAIHLPDSEQRRRTDADVLQMRRYFDFQDLVCCEVQRVQKDTGMINLHTRSNRYGHLENGILLRVQPQLIMRQEKHMEVLPCGVYLLLGKNGYIWIGAPPRESDDDSLNYAVNQAQVYQCIPRGSREDIVRVRNCVQILANRSHSVSSKNVTDLFDLSKSRGLCCRDLLLPQIGNTLLAELESPDKMEE